MRSITLASRSLLIFSLPLADMALSTPLLDISVHFAPINNTDIPDRIIYSDTFGYIMRI